MTLRERIADWISGAAVSDSRETIEQLFDRWHKLKDENFAARRAFRTIAAMETPNANATVKRMARTAREALK